MSTAKKSGSRDISDLKARLGLKKQAPTGSHAAVPPPAGVAPPPGRPGAIPAPPGVVPPRPFVQQQYVPDASEDPFGAMNAMAANQAAYAAPAIVVVNDGLPIAKVEGKTSGVRYAVLAATILGPLIVGVIIGQIGQSAKSYNRTIADSSKIRVDVDTVGKQLIELQQILEHGRVGGPKNAEGAPWYKPNDEALTKALGEFPALAYDPEVVYKSFLYELPFEISEQIFLYYTQLGNLKKMLKEHLKKSPTNLAAIVKAQERLQGFNPAGFAAIFSAPSADEAKKGQPAQLRVVQLGLPICEVGGKPTEEGCGATIPAESQYRLSETSPWGTKKVVGVTDAAPDGSLVLINPGTPFFMGIIKGGEASVGETSYMDRIGDIHNQVEDLVKVRKFILDVLNNKANESPRFTFFL